MTKPRRQITQEERRPRIIRPSALPLGDRAARERLSVHRLRKSIKAAPLYARLRTVPTAIIAAADAARADRRGLKRRPFRLWDRHLQAFAFGQLTPRRPRRCK